MVASTTGPKHAKKAVGLQATQDAKEQKYRW